MEVHSVHPTWKKENNSAEKEGCVCVSLFLALPIPFQQKQWNWNIERRILLGCAPCTMIQVYTLPAARRPWSIVSEINLQELTLSLLGYLKTNFTPPLNPMFDVQIWQMIHHWKALVPNFRFLQICKNWIFYRKIISIVKMFAKKIV